MIPQPPVPAGLAWAELGGDQIDAVLAEVFVRGVRCGLLDTGTGGVPAFPGHPQWLLAELGDGRITGSCPGGTWRRSDTPPTADLSAPSLDPGTDRWRILEVLVFGPHTQIRLGEGARSGWISADAPVEVPPWLRPRDRSFLLQGWNGPDHSRTLEGEVPLAVTGEPSGNTAVLPAAWADFTVRSRRRATSEGTWLTVREYWAEDPATGAVGVAFHRLTGVRTGPKPTGPLLDPATGDELPHGRGPR
ncbi:hypothetical protein [Nocardiopsis algeriensis]|uniref:Uncharacterized protein n=1 Tax=Nocardiopsis algeriensis TaxID=1478215 RepID=A0A841ILS2_9ACTN|nr:hypothetical protein [Nocardiopsis algeriensis]